MNDYQKQIHVYKTLRIEYKMTSVRIFTIVSIAFIKFELAQLTSLVHQYIIYWEKIDFHHSMVASVIMCHFIRGRILSYEICILARWFSKKLELWNSLQN